MVQAQDLGEYYRILPDGRDLNYNKFVEDGEEIITQAEEYHSHNTKRLDKAGLKDLLINLRELVDIK